MLSARCFPRESKSIRFSERQAHLLPLLSPPFLILSFSFPPNMSCSSQLTSCSPYWLSYVPCKHALLLFKENDLCLQPNSWGKKKKDISLVSDLVCLELQLHLCQVISPRRVHVVQTSNGIILMKHGLRLSLHNCTTSAPVQMKFRAEWPRPRHTLLHTHAGTVAHGRRCPTPLVESESSGFIEGGGGEICSSPASACQWIPKFN